MRRAAAIAAIVAAAVAVGCRPQAEPRSFYTSIRPSDCQAPPQDVAAAFTARDLGVQQCPAPEGWRLLVVASDANAWIELRGPGLTWSGEQPIVYDSPIGLFPSVNGSERVEWRWRGEGRPTAVIFRVTARDRETLTGDVTALFVIRLMEDRGCVIGRVDTEARARQLADGNLACPV